MGDRLIRVCLAALLALLLIGPFGLPGIAAPALAEEEAPPQDLAIDFTVKPGEMVAPGDVTMTFTLRNTSDHTVQNVYLSSADGLLSEPIGHIGAGETQTLVRPHTVTQEELDAGVIAYTVSHDPADPAGEKVIHQVSVAIVKGDPRPSLDFTRQLSSEYTEPGGLVTITYKVRNTGNISLTSLRIRDSLGDFTGRQELLEVGDTKTFISRVTITEATVSEPILEYSVITGGTYTRSLEPIAIQVAESALDASFSVGRSVLADDTADAILTLTNYGSADYSGITILDDVYGGVIADSISLPSGGRPQEITHTYPIRGQAQYRWRVTGTSGTGEALDMLTNTLTLSSAAGDSTVSIELRAEARTPRINRAGTVWFDISIYNRGSAMAEDALLYEVNQGQIRQLAVLPTGDPTTLSCAYDIQSGAQFIFCLNYTDADGRQRTVSTAPIEVTIAPDGVTPEARDTQELELEGESVRVRANSSSFTVVLIAAAAVLLVMFTVLLVTSLRARRDRRRTRIAAEKQRVKEELERTGAASALRGPRRRRRK